MKLVLIQPTIDEIYKHNKLGYGFSETPPETGLAVLAAWVRAYSKKQPVVQILNPYASFEENVDRVANADFLGISDWFINHRNCIRMADATKEKNPNVKVILGGPNATTLGGLALQCNSTVDYIVGSRESGDGEESLRGIIDDDPEHTIPNLWYRMDGQINYSYSASISLNKLPLWNFDGFEDIDVRLQNYLRVQMSDPWQVSPLTVFSFRGCMKVIREGRMCDFCTSAGTEQGRALSPYKFWGQLDHLRKLYGANVFQVADDIFPTSMSRMKCIADSKPQTTQSSRIRAYAYLPFLDLESQKIKRMAGFLEKIGIFNLFWGTEHFDPRVLARAHKKGVGVDATVRILRHLYEQGGIKATITFLLGHPGESEETLEANLSALKALLQRTGDAFERLYISVVVPLRGSEIYNLLVNSEDVNQDYHRQSGGKILRFDDYPDYKLLAGLMVKHFSSVDISTLMKYMNLMVEEATAYLSQDRIVSSILEI